MKKNKRAVSFLVFSVYYKLRAAAVDYILFYTFTIKWQQKTQRFLTFYCCCFYLAVSFAAFVVDAIKLCSVFIRRRHAFATLTTQKVSQKWESCATPFMRNCGQKHETRAIHASDVRFSWVDGDALNNTKTAWKRQNKKPNMLKCESYERFCCKKFKCSAKKPLIRSGVLVSTLIVQHSLIPLKSREQETNNA